MKEVAKKVRLLKPIDVSEISIRKDQYFPNAYLIDLPLDSTPDHVWQDIFENEWKSSRHLWERKIFVICKQLRLVTSLDKIEEKLEWVIKVVEQTNISIEEFNREAEARELEILKIEEALTRRILEEERAATEMIRDILRKRIYTL